MADVTIADVVSGTIDGTGSFDKLMEAMTLHLKEQYDAGRITGTDYADVYLGGLQSVMAQAVQFTLGVNRANEEAALLAQKLVTEEAQTTGAVGTVAGVVGAQMSLYDAQKDGFQRDAEQKLIKICLDSWAVAMSVDTTGDVLLPHNITQDALISLIETARVNIESPSPAAYLVPQV